MKKYGLRAKTRLKCPFLDSNKKLHLRSFNYRYQKKKYLEILAFKCWFRKAPGPHHRKTRYHNLADRYPYPHVT